MVIAFRVTVKMSPFYVLCVKNVITRMGKRCRFCFSPENCDQIIMQVY